MASIVSRAAAGGDGDVRSHLLAISGSGRWVAVSRPAAQGAGAATPGAMVEVFELPQGAPAGRWTCPEPISALTLLGDDVLVAGTRGGSILGWEPAPERWAPCTQLTKVHDGPVRALAADGTGTRLVSAGDDGALRVYAVSFASGAPALELVAERWVGRSPLSAAAIDAAGSLVAVAGRDGLVRLLPLAHATGGAVQAVWTVPASVQAVSFAARNAVVAALGVDGMVYAQAIDGAAPRAGWPDGSRHAAPPSGLAWIAGGGLGTAVPTGRLLSADEQGEARSWTLAAVPEESKVCWRGRGRVYDVAGFVGTVGPVGAGLAAQPGAALLTDRDVVLVAMTAPDALQVAQRLPLADGAAVASREGAGTQMGQVIQGTFGAVPRPSAALDAVPTEELSAADLDPGLLPRIASRESGPSPTMLEEIADLGARRSLGPLAFGAAAAGVVGVGAVALAAPALGGAPAAGAGAVAQSISAGAAAVAPSASLPAGLPAASPAELLGGPSAGGPGLGGGHGLDPVSRGLAASGADRPLTSTRESLPVDEAIDGHGPDPAPRVAGEAAAAEESSEHVGAFVTGGGRPSLASPASEGAAWGDELGRAARPLQASGDLAEGAASPGASVLDLGSRGAASAPSGASAAASAAAGSSPSSVLGGSGAVGLAESAGSGGGSAWVAAAAAGGDRKSVV